MNAIDLFCGAGGASRGLHDAGYDVVGFDHWQPAVDTHNANGMPAHLHDLSDESLDNLIPECDLMWLSPPCQPFSAAGDGEGEFDGRDGFPWALRIVDKVLPPVVVFENVKGLTFRKHHAYFAGVLEALRGFGYHAEWKVLNSADYGVPQTRERCIIVARRDGGRITWPTVTHTEQAGMFTQRWVSMADALGWGMSDKPFFTIPGRESDGGPRMDGCGGSGARANLTAERDAGRWVLDYRQNNRDGEPIFCDVTARPSPTITHGSESQWIIRTNQQTTGGDGMYHRLINEPAPSVTSRGDNWSRENGDETIRLSIAELARLQDFPADWTWTGTKTQQARMIGNAVPRTLARVVAEGNRPTQPSTADDLLNPTTPNTTPPSD